MTAPRLTRADLLTPAIAARMRPADRKALGIPEPGAAAAKVDAMEGGEG